MNRLPNGTCDRASRHLRSRTQRVLDVSAECPVGADAEHITAGYEQGGPVMTTSRARSAVLVGAAVVALELFTGVGAIYGTVMLVTDGWHLPVRYLEPLPLHSWVLPGVALCALVAVPTLTAAALAIPGTSRAADAAIGVGLLLAGWIVLQLTVIGPRMVLQPVMLAVGLTIAALGWWWRRIYRRS